MAKKGRVKYVPPNILIEMESIKQEENIVSDAEAMRKLAGYSRAGREAKRKKWL